MLYNYKDPLIGAHDPKHFSLDLLALFIPGGHWLFNQWTQSYWSKLPGNINESSVFLGLPVYVFMGYAWIKRKTLDLVDRQQIYLWFITLAFFFVLALGPVLHIAGKTIQDDAIPNLMPYKLLVSALPFLNLSGMPVRMVVMVILCASVLSGMGLAEIFRRFPRNLVFILILLAILIFETFPKPLPATRIEVPEYVTALVSLPNDGGMVDLVTNDQSIALYYQTIDNKPIVFGYVSRLPTSVSQEEVELKKTIENQDFIKLWDKYHIRYVVTHNIIQVQDVESYMSFQKIYDKNDIRIYRIGCKCE